jgi:hypothetical protein
MSHLEISIHGKRVTIIFEDDYQKQVQKALEQNGASLLKDLGIAFIHPNNFYGLCEQLKEIDGLQLSL